MKTGSVFYVAVNLHVHRLSSKWLQFVTFWFVKLTIWRENNVSCSVTRGLNISSTFLVKQEIGTHVQYTQTDTNRQETLTNGTVGKISPLVKEALWFAPLVRMESSSVHRTIYYSGFHYYLRAVLKAICWLVPLVQIDSFGKVVMSLREPCVNYLSIGTIGTNGINGKGGNRSVLGGATWQRKPEALNVAFLWLTAVKKFTFNFKYMYK